MTGPERNSDGKDVVAVTALTIAPEPTGEELAAIVSAVTLLDREPVTTTLSGDKDGSVSGERWRQAARREAMRAPLNRRQRG